jgi:hypothetical protein
MQKVLIIRAGSISIAMFALALAVAGCVATPASSGAGVSHTAAAPSTYTQEALAYARCERSHGVTNFPDPNADGTFPKDKIPAGSGPKITAANRTCGHLLPSRASGQVVTAKEQQDYIKAAACMRSHGVAAFPDPVFSNGGDVTFPVPASVDSTSTQFTSARAVCAKLIPAGLPYSGTSG